MLVDLLNTPKHRFQIKCFLLISLFLSVNIASIAQTGPGGVGNSSTNRLWLKADDLTAGTVASWLDQSGNSHNFSRGNSSERPVLVTNIINGKPVVRFDGNNDDLVGPASNTLLGGATQNITAYVVFRSASTNEERLFQVGIDGNANRTLFGITLNNTTNGSVGVTTRTAPGSSDLQLGHDADYNNGVAYFIEGRVNNANRFVSINGTQQATDASDMANTSSNTSTSFIGSRNGNDHFEGDIAEIILYNTSLNVAQRAIVSNYLSTKYSIAITNDYYNNDGLGNDLAGIGQLSGTSHTAAKSAGILTISNPSALDNGDFLFFGHGNGSISSWSTNELPASFTDMQRVSREWYVQETGDVGTVDVTIDADILPSLNSGYTNYYLLVDDDGDFTNGVSAHLLQDIGGNEFQVTGLDLINGNFVTIAAVAPRVAFVSTTSSAFEDAGTANISVALNYAIDQAVTVVFTADGASTATGGGNDYSSSSSPITIPSGSASADIVVTLVDNGDDTGEETLILNLSAPSNAALGLPTQHTLTINDIDNIDNRTIGFTTTSASNAESITSPTISISSSRSDASPISVDYAITGGTATANTDFILGNGTATITSGTSTSIAPQIINDQLFEASETITITLSNPVNANLDPAAKTFTYTITDDDTQPNVSFSVASFSFNESLGTGYVLVNLSTISGQGETVPFIVTNGSANQGNDFSIPASSIIVPKGSKSARIPVIISNDDLVEGSEDFTITLTGSNTQAPTIATINIGDDDNDDIGFTGPAGIGNSLTNRLWLRADDLSAGTVATWADQSGNGFNYSRSNTSERPSLASSVLNGKPVVRFDGNNDDLTSSNSNTALGGGVQDITIFTVFRSTSTQNSRMVHFSADGNANRTLIGTSINHTTNGSAGFVTRTSAGSADLDIAQDADWNDGNGHILVSKVDDANRYVYIDGTLRASDTQDMLFTSTNDGTSFLGSRNGNDHFNGDLAEVIVYRRALNEAQRRIVENHLSTRWGIGITHDYFVHDGSHAFGIAGIGQANGEKHTAAQSDGILTIKGAGALADGDFLMIGHDNDDITAWSSTEVPDASTQRLAREWRADVTNSPGLISISLDTAGFPTPPAGYGYCLLIDTDGNFEEGSEKFKLNDDGTGELEVSGVDIPDGAFIAIAIVEPTVQFALTESEEFESSGPHLIVVELSTELSADATVNYSITGGTAISGTDFILSDGTLEFFAGETSSSIVIELNDDTNDLDAVTVELTLSNPSSNISLGTNTVHLFTINDDDNTRKLSFTTPISITEVENAGAPQIDIPIQYAPADGSTVSVDYFISGGTATAGVDYTFSEGTATINGPASSVTIPLTLIDDGLAEGDETIEITLTNPTNANLETSNTTYTITIDDDEPTPTVDFSDAESSEVESIGTAAIRVELSSIMGQDVTVDYILDGGGTATQNSDFTFTNGTLTILAGELYGFINIGIIDDGDIENSETINLELTSSTVADLPSPNPTHIFTIGDNDDAVLGFSGPGGVGNSASNVLWLRTDELTGSSISLWEDISGNGNDYSRSNSSERPQLVSGILNGRPVVRFDGNNDDLAGGNTNTVLSGAIQDATIFAIFRSTTTSEGRLVHFTADGNANRTLVGPTINGISNGSIGFTTRTSASGSDLEIGQDSDWNDGVGHILVSQVDNADRFVYVDGALEASDAQDMLYTSTNDGTSFIGSRNGNDHYEGDLGEIIVYRESLNEAQRRIVENYLSSRWGAVISNDYYVHDANYNFDLAGIGQVNGENHTSAQSAGFLKISGASELEDGDFLLFGHDNEDKNSWTTSEAPFAGNGIQRIAREWVFDETNEVGNVTISVNIDSLPALPSGFDNYAILVDGDGNFESGATTYMLSEVSASEYQVANVNIANASYLTIGVTRSQVLFAETTSNVFETESPGLINVVLSNVATEDITVDYAITGGTAVQSTDFILADGTLTIPAGSVLAQLSVTVINNGIAEGSRDVEITLSNPSGGYSLGTNTVHTLTILDDDDNRKISFDQATLSADEDAGQIVVTIVSTATSPDDIEVDYAITGGTALDGVDFDFTPATAVINGDNTDTDATFTFDILEDALSEGPETIEITLSNPVNGNLDDTNTTLVFTINDNEALPVVAFNNTTVSAAESQTNVAIEFSIDQVAGQDVTIDYVVEDITATNGVDYILIDGQATITSGDLIGEIVGTVISDTDEENSETFKITITNTSLGTIGAADTVIYTISNDDTDAIAITGPGGVGDALTNKLWVRTDGLPAGQLQTWPDISGNGNDYSRSNTSERPSIVANVLNNRSVLRFDGNNDDMTGPNSNTALGGATQEITSFVVLRSTTTSEGRMLHYTADNNENRTLFGPTINVTSNGSLGFVTRTSASGSDLTIGDDNDWNDGTGHILVSQVDNAVREVYIDGTLEANDTQDMLFTSTNNGTSFIGSRNGNDHYEGDLGEIITYNVSLNETQRRLVENYLSSRWNIGIANDYFIHDASFGNDVAGIGQVSSSDKHIAAQSAGILEIGAASNLNDGKFLLFGHNNGSISGWTSIGAPQGGTAHQIIPRQWVLDETGDVGSISVSIDFSALPAIPSGYDNYLILVDENGDFSEGATEYRMTQRDGDIYEATGVEFNDGNFIAISVSETTIQFVNTTGSALESQNPGIVQIELSNTAGTDVSVNYTITGGSASGGGIDYTLANGTATITKGNLTTQFSITIINDLIQESTETIEITLSNPTSGIALGTNSVHTFSINDNDNNLKLSFATPTDNGDEDTTPVPTTIQIDGALTSAFTITVDYSVVGGTATPGIDFTLLGTGQATIPIGDSQVGFDILSIAQDALSEADETVIIALSNPQNANLANTNTTFIYTINDDEVPPTVEFSFTATSGAENVSIGDLEVRLNAISGQDIAVTYEVDPLGNATATLGDDFVLTDGTLIIPAGSISADIKAAIVDDSEIEVSEEFTVSLTGATGATLGALTTSAYIIGDNDSEIGSTGPGGVGNQLTNLLWLNTDILIDGSLASWADQSGNGHTFSRSNSSERPTVVTNQLNGFPVVEFDGNNDDMTGPPTNTLLSGALQDITIFTVFRTSSASEGRLFHAVADNNENRTLIGPTINPSGSGSAGFITRQTAGGSDQTISDNDVYNDNAPHIMVSWVSNENRRLIIDGTEHASDTDDMLFSSTNNGTSFIGSRNGNEHLEGDIVEIIVYGRALNTAQIMLVENYLSSKLDIPVANDYYAYDGSYNFGVAGLGRVDLNNIHSAGTSANILGVSGATALGDGDFTLIGHNNGGISTWQTNEVPNSDPNYRKLAREWRIDKTGTPGNLTFTVDETLLPTKPAGYINYFLLIDADGDFSSGATQYQMTDQGDGTYEVTNVSVNDGNYIGISIARTTIEFANATSAQFESNSPALISVELNNSMPNDVTIDYTITGGTALSGTDYVLSNGTVTITEGSTSASIVITLVNDIAIESNETITLALSNPSDNMLLGNQSTHTFTINDDDNARKISFVDITDSDNENNAANIGVTIQATSASTSNIEVDYIVTGGTASSGLDFNILGTGTATIPGDNTTTQVALNILEILDDNISEDNETIIVSLSNPINGNLAANNTTFTFTIVDTDPEPTVDFAIASSAGIENATPALIEVELTAISGQDIDIDYVVDQAANSTATNGVDYTLTDGTITIPAGSSSIYFSVTIGNDTDPEPNEFFTITLTSANGAILAGDLTHTFTITDDDNNGFTGPGGVGNEDIIRLWLMPDGLTAGGLQTWADSSGNGNDFTNGNAAERPTVNTNQWNGFPSVDFDGANDRLLGPNGVNLLDGGVQNLSVISVFRTTATGDGRLITIAADNNANRTLFASTVNNGGAGRAGMITRTNTGGPDLILNDNGGWNDGNAHILRNMVVSANRGVHIDGTLEASDTQDMLFTSSNTATTYLGSRNANDEFNGELGEIIVFTTVLDTTQFIIIENYLAAKYGMTIANDYYNEGNYYFRVGGIGRESATDFHQTAQPDIIKLDNVSDLDDGEYFFIGDDNGDVTAWTSTGSPAAGSVEIVDRIWKMDETGDVGTVNFTIDLAEFDALPPDFLSYSLVVDTDGDEDFTTGTVSYYPLNNVSGSIYLAENVDVGDYYFTVAAVSYITQTSGDFDNAGTWAGGLIPGENDEFIIDDNHTVTLTANQEIGGVTIRDGATLALDIYRLDVKLSTINLEGTGNLNPGTGTVRFSANAAQCINAMGFHNLEIAGSNTKSLCGDIDVNGNISISSGAVTFEGGSSGYTINLAGNWSNSGAFSAGDATVIFDGTSAIAGPSITQFGNVTVTGTLNGPTSINLIITGDFINNGTFNDNNGFVEFDGTTTLSGSSIFNFNSVVINNSLIGIASGNFNVSGNWQNNGSYDGNNGSVTFDGNTAIGGTAATDFHDVIISGSVTAPQIVTMNVSGDFNNNGTFNTNNGTVLFNGVSNITGTSPATFNNISVSGTLNGPALLTISGNFVNNGTFDGGTGEVLFSGSGIQSISGSANPDFYDFEINNSAGVTLGVTINIENNLQFTTGDISTSGGAYVLFQNGAGYSGLSSGSHVAGPAAAQGTGNFVFPIGTGDVIGRLGISGLTNADAGTIFTASYSLTGAINGSSLGSGINNVSKLESWDLSRTNDTGNDASVIVSLYVESAERSDISDDGADLLVAYYNGSEWTNLGGSFDGTRVTATSSLNTFSPITLGSSDGDSPLPVEMVSFTGYADEGIVYLNWETASELNNDHFEVQRSSDGEVWETIGQVEGNGTTSSPKSYNFRDNQAGLGLNYYRLKQMDTDGTFEYSEIISVETITEAFSLSFYPNPFDKFLDINIKGLSSLEAVNYSIRQLTGAMVIDGKLTADTNGRVSQRLSLPNQVSAGVYILTLETNEIIKQWRIIRR